MFPARSRVTLNDVYQLLYDHLHPIERATLEYLIIHLINVIKMRDYNGMDLTKIINIWTPLLCRDIINDDINKCETLIGSIFDLKHVNVNTMSCVSMPELRDNCDNNNINKRQNKIKAALRLTKHSMYENF